jgi:hypothetical protein
MIVKMIKLEISNSVARVCRKVPIIAITLTKSERSPLTDLAAERL